MATETVPLKLFRKHKSIKRNELNNFEILVGYRRMWKNCEHKFIFYSKDISHALRVCLKTKNSGKIAKKNK